MNQTSVVRLDEQLCFALCAATNGVIRVYRPLLDQVGLTYPQYLTLMVPWESDDLPVRQIADRLQLPANALTPVLARLEQKGHLTRTRDGDDARVLRVRLTRRDRALQRSAAVVQREVVCRTGLDESSPSGLRAQLRRLVDDLRSPTPADRSDAR